MMRGHEGLREELARYLGAPQRDAILTTGGSSNGIMIALAAVRRLLLRGGAGATPPRAVVEAPTYRPLFDVADYLGFEVSTFRRDATDGYRLHAGAIRDAMPQLGGPVVLVVSNLHNPTSAEATAAEIRDLLGAVPTGSFVLVDETFINAGRGRDSVARLGDPHLIALGSLSKDPGLSALRCGWIIAYGDTLAEMRRAWVHGFNIGSPITEAAACEAVRRLPEMNGRTGRLLAENLKVADNALAPLRAKG